MLLGRQEVAPRQDRNLGENVVHFLAMVVYARGRRVGRFVASFFILQAATVAIGIGLLEAGLTEKQSLWASPLILGMIVAIVGANFDLERNRGGEERVTRPGKTVESERTSKNGSKNKTR